MTLLHILVFSVAASAFSLINKGRWRNWLMLVASVLAVYWMQSVIPIRRLDFWLPTATLGLLGIIWASTQAGKADEIDWRETVVTAGIVTLVVLVISVTRYVDALCCITPSSPPAVMPVLLVAIAITATAFLIMKFRLAKKWLILLQIIILLGLLVVIKTEPLALQASAVLRALAQQSVERASAFDIRWLGFSYVAFRLTHVLLDWVYGRLPTVQFREFVTYVVFFPAFSAGPIDRVERFIKDTRSEFVLDAANFRAAIERIVLGLLKKFVLADGLALLALNAQNASQVTTTGWLWLALYAYAFRLFFDFAGYSDIAIGIGMLMGVKLPENFSSPYIKPNLTTFWNSWHMTLAQWFRAYWFNPTTRALRTRKVPVWLIILFGQMTTMIFIGLWHGVTWNFAIWGAWHGLGLFLHNRWTNATRTKMRQLQAKPAQHRAFTIAGMLLTFHYVLIGWVWFALPDFSLAQSVFLKLFGISV